MKREMNQIKELFFFSINNEIIKFFFSTTYISKTSKKFFLMQKDLHHFNRGDLLRAHLGIVKEIIIT
jgi:hypothetical protein